MPTGYTADIAKGISFEQFVWTCARAFGALVMMRDEPMSAPIPHEFTPSNYYAESLAKAEAEVSRLRSLTFEQAQAESAASFQRDLNAWDRRADERAALREKYEVMLASVQAWTPPTAEHQELKDFMAKQITDSIDWDCSDKYDKPPENRLARVWLSLAIAEAERSLEYARKSHAEEVERVNERNRWLKALRESVPPPAAKD